ncbi:hypothetical protein BDQ17DRAFT_1327861 [Cyathus striatus]|nr:hypothetical protein BDQ17DRAFT_1327861 [Cyathus striatus]
MSTRVSIVPSPSGCRGLRTIFLEDTTGRDPPNDELLDTPVVNVPITSMSPDVFIQSSKSPQQLKNLESPSSSLAHCRNPEDEQVYCHEFENEAFVSSPPNITMSSAVEQNPVTYTETTNFRKPKRSSSFSFAGSPSSSLLASNAKVIGRRDRPMTAIMKRKAFVAAQGEIWKFGKQSRKLKRRASEKAEDSTHTGAGGVRRRVSRTLSRAVKSLYKRLDQKGSITSEKSLAFLLRALSPDVIEELISKFVALSLDDIEGLISQLASLSIDDSIEVLTAKLAKLTIDIEDDDAGDGRVDQDKGLALMDTSTRTADNKRVLDLAEDGKDGRIAKRRRFSASDVGSGSSPKTCYSVRDGGEVRIFTSFSVFPATWSFDVVSMKASGKKRALQDVHDDDGQRSKRMRHSARHVGGITDLASSTPFITTSCRRGSLTRSIRSDQRIKRKRARPRRESILQRLFHKRDKIPVHGEQREKKKCSPGTNNSSYDPIMQAPSAAFSGLGLFLGF